MAEPIKAVSAVITADNHVLLVQRGNQPAQGLWSLPGGSVEEGETLIEAVVREVFEETSLHVTVGSLIFHQEIVLSPTHSYDLHTFVAHHTGGSLRAGDDAADAKWFRLKEISQLATTPRLVEIITRARDAA